MKCIIVAACCLFTFVNSRTDAQTAGTLKSYYRIDVAPGSTLADTATNWFAGAFGACMVPDVDGDSNPEVMVVSRIFPAGNTLFHQLRLRADGTVKPSPPNTNLDKFPTSVWNRSSDFIGFGSEGSISQMGDLDGNGVVDLAIGNSQGGADGEFYVAFMSASGRIDSLRQIRPFSLGFDTSIAVGGYFGSSLTNIGDLDSDGVPDLAIGQPLAGIDYRGMLWIMFMTKRGHVKGWKALYNGSQNIPTLSPGTSFGQSVAGIGDLDLDGIGDLAVTSLDSDQTGSLWTLFLNRDGSIKRSIRNRASALPLLNASETTLGFGNAITNIGDIDGDGITDVAVCQSAFRDAAGKQIGRVFILFMNRDGSIKGRQVIDRNNSDLGTLKENVSFGFVVFSMGDFNKDGVNDIGVTMPADDAAAPTNFGRNSGGFYILNLNGVPVKTSTGDIITNNTADYFAYPNPASDKLTIRNHDNVSLPFDRVSIVDVSGRLVRQQQVNAKTAILDLSLLMPGTYFIRVQRAGQEQTIQFTKN